MDDGRSDLKHERDLAAALAHYAALTGNARASLDDPMVRRFCEAYYDAAQEALASPRGSREGDTAETVEERLR